jgi:hypothetical protein
MFVANMPDNGARKLALVAKHDDVGKHRFNDKPLCIGPIDGIGSIRSACAEQPAMQAIAAFFCGPPVRALSNCADFRRPDKVIFAAHIRVASTQNECGFGSFFLRHDIPLL